MATIQVRMVDGSTHGFDECYWTVERVGLSDDGPHALVIKSEEGLTMPVGVGPDEDPKDTTLYGCVLAAFPWDRVQAILMPGTMGLHDESIRERLQSVSR